VLCSGICSEGEYSLAGSALCFNITGVSGSSAIKAKSRAVLQQQIANLQREITVRRHTHQRRVAHNSGAHDSRASPQASYEFDATSGHTSLSSTYTAGGLYARGAAAQAAEPAGAAAQVSVSVKVDTGPGSLSRGGASCPYADKTVHDQWVGPAVGAAWCNQCLCAGGKLVCTRKDCGTKPTPPPPPVAAAPAPMAQPTSQPAGIMPGPHQCLHHKRSVVSNGWVGRGLGSNWCNMCICEGGMRHVLADQLVDVTTCSMNVCHGPKPTPAPTPALDWASMCKHGNRYVANGWSGQGEGDQWCNHCLCAESMVSCSTLQCGPNPDDCTDGSAPEHTYHDGWFGKAAPDSKHWCTQCMCVKGVFACAPLLCEINPLVPTAAPTINPASCVFNNKLVHDGWFGDNVGNQFCNTCACKQGKLFCTNEVCRQRCNQVMCPNAGVDPVCPSLHIVREESEWHGCCFNSAYDCAIAKRFAMVDTEAGGYLGMAPYMAGGGQVNRQPSESDCRDQCLGMANCLVGTFVPQESAVQNSLSGVIGGECWLADHMHANLRNCDKTCKSFKKIPLLSSASKKKRQKKGQSPLPTVCQCDPARHHSTSVRCVYDLMAQQIAIHYLDAYGKVVTEAEYSRAHESDEHLCKVVGGHCKCCTCVGPAQGSGTAATGLRSRTYTSATVQPSEAFGIKNVMTGWFEGAAPYLAGGGSKNIQPSLAACKKQCAGMATCTFGSFTTAGAGTGECWLAQHVKSPSKCSRPCISFAKQNNPKMTLPLPTGP
jgi:hypothetical protein